MTGNRILSVEESGIHLEGACLIGIAGEFQGRIIRLAGRVRLGRHPQNDLCFSDPTVSTFHAQITAVNDSYEIMDLRSKNRSKVNGKRIERPVMLLDNDVIEIGKNVFSFRVPQHGWPHGIPHPPDEGTSRPQNRPSPSSARSMSELGAAPPRAAQSGFALTPADGLWQEAGSTRRPRAGLTEATEDGGSSKGLRIIAGLTLCGLPVLTAGLIASRSVIGRFTLHVPEIPATQETVSPGISQEDYPDRLGLFRQIWQRWESEPPQQELSASEVDALLNEALCQTEQFQDSTPQARWGLYKTCLEVAKAAGRESQDSPGKRQAEQLLLRVKIEIEDAEHLCWRNLWDVRSGAGGPDARQILREVMDLADLQHDNKDSELAQLYSALEQELRQEQTNHRILEPQM